MQQNSLLKVLFVLIWLIAIINAFAEHFHLYWIYRWFDIPMHFIGGVWVGLAVLWFVYVSGHVPQAKTMLWSTLQVALYGGFLIGFLWELYEYVIWQWSGSGLPPNYYPDSLLDLIMDTLGTLVAYGVYARLWGRSAHTELEHGPE